MKGKLLLLFLILSLNSVGQVEEKSNFVIKSSFSKKMLFGLGVNNSWANFYDLKDSTFYRPSLGMHLRVAYYPKPFIGINFGAGIQQRGMGIYTRDVDNSIGNPDSTGRLRYKSACIDFPIEIAFRPKITKGSKFRPHFGAGTTVSYLRKAERIWKSVDDGFHQSTNITNNFDRIDVLLRCSFGAEFQIPGNGIFRVQGVFENGFKPLFLNAQTNMKTHKQRLIGIDLTFIY